MKRTFLGEFEEIVLLVVAGCTEEAYGVTIWERVQEYTGRAISLSAVHATLYRLEEKGFLTSEMGGATAERGGRRKRPIPVLQMVDLQRSRNARINRWRAAPNQQGNPIHSIPVHAICGQSRDHCLRTPARSCRPVVHSCAHPLHPLPHAGASTSACRNTATSSGVATVKTVAPR